MGRVGDGGGLRLEKEKETGKETGIIAELFFRTLTKSHHAHAHAIQVSGSGHNLQ